MICEDNRSATLDAGNVKLTYNSLLEKAEAKEKERVKEESRKLRKLETNFRTLLAKLPIEPTTPWEKARNIDAAPAFPVMTAAEEDVAATKKAEMAEAGANPSILTCLVAIRAILKATQTRTAGNRKSPKRSSVTDRRRVTSTQVAARPKRNHEAKKVKNLLGDIHPLHRLPNPKIKEL